MLRRVDLFPDLESDIMGLHRGLSGFSNAIAASDRIIADLEVVTNTDGVRLAGMDLQIRQNLSKGFAAGLGIGLLLSGAAWIVSSALVPSSSYPAVPIVLGSLVAASGLTVTVLIILPDAKKALK